MNFTKTYKGTIKRKISEGVITPTTLPEIYLKTTNAKVEISSGVLSYPSKIFNIVKSKGKTEITSNTLAIKLTTTEINSKPYYKFIENLPIEYYNQLLVNKHDVVIKEDMVYINTDLSYIQIGQDIYKISNTISINLWERTDNLTVRRLKDRFKITIKHEEEIYIDLLGTSIFHPTIQNNNLYYYDCVFNSSHFLYTHSFETYTKEEVHHYSNEYILKDIPISSISIINITDSYVKIVYDTFRSNLFFTLNSIEPSTIIIDYIDMKPELKKVANTDSNVQGILEYRPTNNINIEELQINPFMNVKRFNSRPEGIVFVWEGYEDIKYSRPQDIPFGTERVKLKLKDVMEKEIVAFKLDGVEIRQKYAGGVEKDSIPSELTYTKDIDKLEVLLGMIRG